MFQVFFVVNSFYFLNAFAKCNQAKVYAEFIEVRKLINQILNPYDALENLLMRQFVFKQSIQKSTQNSRSNNNQNR